MGKSPSAPDPVDPYEAAQAQTGQNIGTAIGNSIIGNVNQNTPTGSLTYDQTGTTQWTDPTSGKVYDIPQFTATQTLSGKEQKKYNQQTRAETNLNRFAADQTDRLGDLLSSPMDPGSLPDAAGPLELSKVNPRSYARQRERVEGALMKRMQPSLDQDRSRLADTLANRGIGIGSAEYDRAMRNASAGENDARMTAILAGGQEQSRLAGLQMAQTGANNNARIAENTAQGNLRNSALNEAFALRNQPINEIAALLGTGQVNNPQFVNTPVSQMPTTDIAGLMGQNFNQQMMGYNADMNARNSQMGGLFGVGNALLGGIL